MYYAGMNILICNDDGIHAPGIRTLYEAVADLGTVTVVAPSEEQSAIGHAITVFDPIKMRPHHFADGVDAYAVGGTPADCVKLAFTALMDDPPDLVLSGVNLGPNTGIAVIYSGTVSAATEALILGIPSIAFSLTSYTDPEWDTAREYVRRITQKAIQNGIPEKTLLNVNLPNLPLEQVAGCRPTRMGQSRYNERFHERADPRGNRYFWLDGDMELLEERAGTDVAAVEDGYVSVTPIGLELTRGEVMPDLKTWLP